MALSAATPRRQNESSVGPRGTQRRRGAKAVESLADFEADCADPKKLKRHRRNKRARGVNPDTYLAERAADVVTNACACCHRYETYSRLIDAKRRKRGVAPLPPDT